MSTQKSLSQPEPIDKTEERLLLDIEKLRREQPNTLSLYVSLAHLLFFEYDTIPTTNRMYQLVRRGSMGTPAEALKIFWSQLREKAQVRMQKAAFPEGLLRAAEQLLAQFWDEAVMHSEVHLHKERLTLQTKSNQWLQALDKLRAAHEQLKQEQVDLQTQLKNKEQALELSKQQSLEQERKLQQVQLALAQATARHDEQQRQSNKEKTKLRYQLEKIQQQMLQTEERAQAHEKRALLEIEQVRQQNRSHIDKLSQTNQQLQLEIRETKGAQTVQAEQLRQAELEQHQLQAQLNKAQQDFYQIKAQLSQAQDERQQQRAYIRRLEHLVQR